MLPLAVATSIDALAVGVTFAFLNVNILWAVTFIGVITFILSSIGVKVGHVFGLRYKGKAEFAGGLILVLMGCKILLEAPGDPGIGYGREDLSVPEKCSIYHQYLYEEEWLWTESWMYGRFMRA